jgi:2'-5' RNA ligase
MISQNDVDTIKTNAAAGRGLWIGLYLRHGDFVTHPIAPFLPPDAHVTVVHLGKRNTAEQAETVMNVLNRFAENVWDFALGDLSAELTGYGAFWRRGGHTPVALINSATLCSLRRRVVDQLIDAELMPSDTYGFIPHVTLVDSFGAIERTVGVDWPTRRFRFNDCHVVCGDHRVSLR